METAPQIVDSWLVGGGETGELIRSIDWSGTPLGPLRSWPNSLRTTVNLCLASNFPINILWGPNSNQIYNDGYRVIVADIHPSAMGMGYRECWESAWPEVGPPFHKAWAGETSFLENRRMFLTRNGYLEETFFTFSLSPIRNEHGDIAGLFHPVNETTRIMLSERRVCALRELSANTSEARTLRTAFDSIAGTLAGHALDLPFVLLYSIDPAGKQANLVAAAGMERGQPASPESMQITERETWPLNAMLTGAATLQIDDLPQRFPGFCCGPYPEPPHTALARSLFIPGQDGPAAVFIAGVSPRLPFNQEYRQHVEQVITATADALANALAYERERQRAEALAQLDQAKTTFFSNISHEFRTPLTLMLGPLEDVLADRSLPTGAREQIEVSYRNSLRLLRLVNSLLDFSRIESSRIHAVFEPVDLAPFTAELASNFRSAIEKAGLRLVVDCSALPEQVFVDREMWEKIVLNLLSNAFKFTFAGAITVQLRPAGPNAQLIVEDTGSGIPAEELPRIFERFHRVRFTHGRTHEGTGIGLSLVQELVRLHGGTIEAHSSLGRGSAFHVLLPFGSHHLPSENIGAPRVLSSTAVHADAFVEEALQWQIEPEAIQVTGPQSQAPHPPAPDTAERVLVADDNADMREYLRRLLSSKYNVVLAARGDEAYQMAQAARPDLILTDIMMPGMDGFELLSHLRAHLRLQTVPVIFLSARAGEEAGVLGMHAGADDYLVKPFGASELLARVDAHLKLARMRREAEEATAQNERRLRAFVTATSEVVYRMSPDWSEMRQLGGAGFLKDAAGAPHRSWLERYVPPEMRPLVQQAIQQAIAAKTVFELEHRVPAQDGSVSWILSRAVPVLDAHNEIVEWIGAANDITTRKQAEELRESLLKEDHHRIKNNLQVITSMLEMQASQVEDPLAVRLFDEACSRVASIAGIHELLYQSSSATQVDLVAYARNLVQRLLRFYQLETRVAAEVQGEDVTLELERSAPFGLLLHELISNSCKHAFPGDTRGALRIGFRSEAGEMVVTVADTGVGLPSQFDWRESDSLGLQIIHTLADQLGGSIELFTSDGACAEVRVPHHAGRRSSSRSLSP